MYQLSSCCEASIGYNQAVAMIVAQRLLLGCIICCGGCRAIIPATIPSSPRYESIELCDSRGMIERGKPRKVIDAVGWVVGIPSKLTLWNRKVDNHRIGSETEYAIAEYLYENDLSTVKVRINQYAPLEDWRRLRKNKAVGGPWRYTLGAVSVLGEAVLPGRIMGGDRYNPFTNTIHLYSDVPAIALHEAAHAKDFARRKWKGGYSFLYLLPIAPLYHESIASREVIDYLQRKGDWQGEADAMCILTPAYGTYVGSQLGGFVPAASTPIYYGSVLVGHATGRLAARRIRAEQAFRGDRERGPVSAAENEIELANDIYSEETPPAEDISAVEFVREQ